MRLRRKATGAPVEPAATVMTPKDSMAAIASGVAPVMKAEGFRKRRHNFNRASGDDGFVQLLGFQMGAFDPPGTVEIPGLRPNLYGRFTVNLGVFVPAIRRGGLAERDWYSDYQCQVRKRSGELLPERTDVWWRLDHADAASDVTAAIQDYALPWLRQFTGYSAFLDLWEAGGGSAVGLGYPAAPLDVADVLLHLDRRSDARRILTDYVARDHVGGHADVVRDYLAQRDFKDLMRSVGS